MEAERDCPPACLPTYTGRQGLKVNILGEMSRGLSWDNISPLISDTYSQRMGLQILMSTHGSSQSIHRSILVFSIPT